MDINAALLPYLTLALLVIGIFTLRSYALLKVGMSLQILIAYFYGLITPIGLLFLIVFWGLCEIYRNYALTKAWLNFGGLLLLLSLALALANHLVPGFHNLKVIQALQLSPLSSPFTMYLNFDKTMAAMILLLACGIGLKKSQAPFGLKAWVDTAKISAMSILVLIPLALATGYVAFDPKFSNIFWIWALNNLLFVCFAEEVIFRGVVQNYLMQVAHKRGWPPVVPIFIAAALFATLLLGHVYNGPLFIGFTLLAGMFYGYAYYLTQRIEAAILVHFSVNLCHFLLFTYPAVVQP